MFSNIYLLHKAKVTYTFEMGFLNVGCGDSAPEVEVLAWRGENLGKCC